MKTITAFVFFAMVSVACAQLYGRGFGLNGSYNRGIGLVGNGVYNSGASLYGTGVNGAYHNGRSIGLGGTFGPSATLGSIGFGQGYGKLFSNVNLFYSFLTNFTIYCLSGGLGGRYIG